MFWKCGKTAREVSEKPNPMEDQKKPVSVKSGEISGLCGAKTRTGSPCSKIGLANGRCRQHGGLSTGPRIKHGQRARPDGPARRRLSERADQFAQMGNALDLNRELAFMRAIFADWLDQNDENKLHQNERAEAMQIIGETGKLIERVERIRNATALTQTEMQFAQKTMAAVIVEFLPDPEIQRQFVLRMREATGARNEEAPHAPVVLGALAQRTTEPTDEPTDEETDKIGSGVVVIAS